MSLIELAEGLGLNPKKTSNSKGGEYHSACPAGDLGNPIYRLGCWEE